MAVQILEISQANPERVASRLLAGEVGVLPTETVYGLALVPGRTNSVTRVFEMKGRPPELNLPVLIGDPMQLETLEVDFNHTAKQLAQSFWPGPLTIVMGFKSSNGRPNWLNGRIEVAIRFPAFDFLVALAKTTGPLLLTSANAHGDGAKDTASEALQSLHGEPDFVVDAGKLARTPSTIINTRRVPAVVERIGAVTIEALYSFIQDKRLAIEA